LSTTQIVLLAAYALAMAGGQMLFKLAALQNRPSGSLSDRLVVLVHNGYFLAAIVLYAGLTVVWVWILTFTPLSRAYAFLALAFVVTPLAGGLLFGEPISARLIIGIALIAMGLVCVAG